MSDCCNKEKELREIRKSHGKILWLVLFINLSMFVVEVSCGLVSKSTSLLADSLDMLGDSLVYGFSLLVLAKSERWQARTSLLKGSIMLCFGIGVLSEAVFKFNAAVVPIVPIMTWVGFLALAMNGICFAVLWKHRTDNINMQSTWICSRNDLIANCCVLAAAALTAVTSSKWPDLAIGTVIAALFLRSAVSVLRDAFVALREACEHDHLASEGHGHSQIAPSTVPEPEHAHDGSCRH